jgi:N12 class adenine-specific DNA methylase
MVGFTKQPWEMTNNEYTEFFLANDIAYQNALKSGDTANAKTEEAAARIRAKASHILSITQAVKEGHNVPDNVLNAYRQPLTGEKSGHIMESTQGEENERDRELRTDVHTTERGRTEGEGTSLREGLQAQGIQTDEGSRGTGRVPSNESRASQEVRREPDHDRGMEQASLVHGGESSHSGDQQRLTAEPLTLGTLPTSQFKDIILDSTSDIGFNAGAATRFDANLAAIRTLKKLDQEQRQATPEEQSVLAKYAGFGDSAFEGAFDKDHYKETPWTKRGDDLRAITTEEEYQAIEKSRLNAFYTTPEVINTMWKALEKMGLDKLSHPRILEPSAGSGRFLGFQPQELAARSERTAVELDQMTGRILKQLYPESEVYAGMGYQDAPIRKGSIDVAISNVPFGNFPVFDKDFRKDRKKLTRQIHNYFFAKSLDHLRPGGVLAFITSHNTLDAPTAKPIREALAEQADFVGAIRLPKGAFPDTEVVTDIVFLRKRLPEDIPGEKSWLETGEISQMVKSKYGGGYEYPVKANINQYFIDHPDMVLGKNAFSGSMYGGDEYTVESEPGVSLSEKLSRSVDRLPADIIQESKHDLGERFKALPSAINVNEGARVIGEDGKIYIKRQDQLENADLSEADIAKVKGMLAVRDAARAVLEKQLKDRPDDELKQAQVTLNAAYDKYITAHGPLSAPKNAELMVDDPDGPFLKALEHNDVFKKDKKKLTEADQALIKLLQGKIDLKSGDIEKIKMPIFSKRVVHGYGDRPVTTDIDAKTVVQNEVGRLDFIRMAAMLGKSEEEVQKSLADKKLIFKNPIGDWEPADEYLTGDVREKLRIAEAAAGAKPEYKPNVTALKAVQPADIEPGQISVRLGAPWIPADDVNTFVKELLHTYAQKGSYFEYNKVTGEWTQGDDKLKDHADSSALNSEYGTSRLSAGEIIERILNGKMVEVTDKAEGPDGKPTQVRNPQETIAAQEKANLINKAFQDWIWKDADRTKRLSEYYNNTFNNFRPRVFDGSHQELPGMALDWQKKIHSHQKDAIWRVVQDRTALLAHEVGFGKTAVMVGSGMELRRLGLSQKNLYVVPKATHAQFRDQFLDVYPYAKVLFPGDDDFTDTKRQEFVSRAVTGDYDAIILSNEQFAKLPVKPETQAKFLKEEIATIREALEDESALQEQDNDSYRYGRRRRKESRTHKDLQKALDRAEERLKETLAKIGDRSDKTMYFEDMGVDQLFVDEADNFKNLRFTTKMGRIKGLPNSDSQRAWDMYQKTRILQEDGKGNGVVFATGTPISNTIAEMYTQMRYLQEPMLEAKGLKHFDAWAKTFGETTESIEQTPTGQYKLTQRFAKFANAPELNGIWQQVADIRVADEVPEIRKQRPRLVDEHGKERRMVIACPPDNALLNYMKTLAERADKLSGQPEKGADNMLKISSDARKASLDMRMVDAAAPANPDSKIVVASKKIADIFKETTDKKGTQLVFLDMGTPKAKDKVDDNAVGDEDEETGEEQALLKNVYGNLKAQLIAEGVPENQIAFIHDAKNDKQKLSLIKKVNDGEIRVLIGSTSKLGVGVNVQERAAALHHLDCPWKPRDIEQREGRVIRQGNIAFGPKFDENHKIIDPGPGVRVYSYVTERSFDAFMWQAVEAKAKAIKAIMRRSAPPRAVEDVDSLTMSASEAKAIASGNPDVLKAVTLKNSVSKLQMLRSTYIDSKTRANEQLRSIPAQIKQLKAVIGQGEKDARLVKDEPKFQVKVNGRTFEERADAGEALAEAMKRGGANSEIGEYRGFKVRVINQGPQSGYRLVAINPDTGLEHATTNIGYMDLTGLGAISRLDNRIKYIPGELDKTRQQLQEAERNLVTYKAQAAKPFEYQDQLDKMEKELSRINRKLQGEKVEDTPSDNYIEPDVEDADPEYHYGQENEEQTVINPQAEIAAVKAEVEPVEKSTEVKPPSPQIEKIVDQMAEPAKEPEEPRDLGEAYEAARKEFYHDLSNKPYGESKPDYTIEYLEGNKDVPSEPGTITEYKWQEENAKPTKNFSRNKEVTDQAGTGAEQKSEKQTEDKVVREKRRAARKESQKTQEITEKPVQESTEATRIDQESVKAQMKANLSKRFTALKESNNERSTRAQAIDISKANKITVESSDENATERWRRHPGSMDVLGIDTPPHITKATKLPKEKRPGSKLPPLHAKKEGKIYHIKGSGMTRSLKRGRIKH